ncbi:MAG: O-antigen ligase family protein [Oscillospiraceae bacterium]|nr:O-antigen ligase family protein [Oscillospiraceae bacterium]
MTNVLQTSAVWRLLQAIGAFIASTAADSAVVSALVRAWDGCFLHRLFRAVGDSEEPALHASRFERMLRRADVWLSERTGLRDCVSESVPGRFVRWLLRVCSDSKTLAWLTRDGLTGAVLTVLALYAGVDWLLRDVLPVPVLSSGWDEALLAFSALLVLWQRTGTRTPRISRTTSLDICVLLYVLVAFALMVLVSPRIGIAVSGYRAACQYVLWFFVVTRLIRHDGDFRRMYLTMLALAGAIALHGVYQYIIAVPIPEHWVAQAEQSVRTRVFSIFGSPNIMACFMVMFAPMAAGLAYTGRGRKMKLLGWGLAVLMCVSCLFTMSRGGWMAMLVAIVVFAILVDGRLLLLLLAAGVFSLALPFVASRIGFLFTSDFTHANENGGRESRWKLGMSYLRLFGNEWFGMGFGRFGGAVAMQNQIHSYLSYFYMDNYYLKTLTESGYLGLGAFIVSLLGVVVNGMRSLWRAFGTKADGFYAMLSGIFAGLCGTLVHCYFENIFEEPYMLATFWILAAMLVYGGLYRSKERKAE